ncbi:MAG TPA: hypothetical protein VKG92_04385, partial [Flavobacteriales bacterium]|nr:hypothetical protein [Flavobacteriales bacterium]
MNTHGNVLLGYPLTIGTGAAGTLTLTRGILMNSTANVLTINNTLSTGVVGTLASTATPPLTHGSYVTGAVRINFPVGTTTGRSFPLGRGASFNGAVPNENLLKTVAIAAGATAWNGQSLTVSLESGASGTPVAPLTALQTSYAYRLNLNGGNDLSTTATLQISGNNYQFGGALSSDNLIGQQNELFVAQSPSLTGGSWTSRSLTSGAGAFVNNTSYPRVTVATAPGPIGPLATNGEYFILASSTSACSGTPVPGLTTSTTPSACSGVNFTLGISNAQGTGVTYSWEFDNGGGWTAFGTNAPTQLVNQSVSTSYRCTVNCPAGGGSPTFATSTPLTIPMATTFPMDFEVVTPFPSNCWTQTGSATYFYRGTGFSGYGTGTGSAKWDYWNAPSGTVLTLTSPAFTPVPANRQVRFDVAGTQWNGDPLSIDHINLETSTTGPAGPWTLVSDMTNASGGLLQTVPATGAAYNPGAGEWATRIFPIATGTNAIRFRGVAGFGNNVYLDNILIEAVPNCLPPTSVTAVGTSGTTASVSWSGAGTYVVEYGPAATFTTPGTGNTAGAGGTVILGATSPTTIPGLTHPTQYRVFVRHDCTGTGDGYSTNSAGILFYPQPPNDLCPNAPPHTISPGGTISVTGNSYGATDTEGFGALNAWEKLTLTGCVTT